MADDTSFAVASTGQLKNVFAFNRDTDSHGLTDLFELIWGLNFQNAADTNARVRGMGMTAAEMFAAGLRPGAGGAPAPGDWTLIRRLNLYQDAEYTDADGTWQPIRWDVVAGVTGGVRIQREIEEENWQVVGGIQRRNADGAWETAGDSVDVSATTEGGKN